MDGRLEREVERGMGRCREWDGGMNRSREVDGWVIGARGGARDG